LWDLRTGDFRGGVERRGRGGERREKREEGIVNSVAPITIG